MQRFSVFLVVASFLVTPATLASQQAAQQGLTAQSSRITAKKAQDAIWQLPEVQQKAREIQHLSKGQIRVGLMVESEPTRSEPYYTVQVYENQPEHIATIYRFRVSSPGGTITVLDNLSGEYISLRQWRSSEQRTRRG